MSPHRSSYRLSIAADSDSTFLARISDLLACLDLVPERLDARRRAATSEFTILVTLFVSATARRVDLFTRKVSQIALVHSVHCERMADRDRPHGVDDTLQQESNR